MNIFNIPKGQKFNAEALVGPQNIYKYIEEDLIFISQHDKIIIGPKIESKEVFERIESIANKVCKILKHTPITAIGINFLFELDAEEDFAPEINLNLNNISENYKNISDSMLIKNASIHHEMLDDKQIINLNYRNNNDKKSVHFNFHYKVEDNNKYEEIINSFNKNYEKALEYNKEIIK